MHCHVLDHMMPDGMMASLLVINPSQLVVDLPEGEPCPAEEVEIEPSTVVATSVQGQPVFIPSTLPVPPGTEVTFDFQEDNHTVRNTGTTGVAVAFDISKNSPPFSQFDGVPAGEKRKVIISGNPGDEITYECGIHGAQMSGKIQIS